jgi:DNA-binding response OmpR family regulator
MQVLLADDDVSFTRPLLQEVIEGRGHQVTPVEDGEAAWRAYQELRHPLVLLDWEMPELDGLGVCRRIRSAPDGHRAFILMITARAAADDAAAAVDAGADDYLAKPITLVHLCARLAIAERRIEQNAARWAAEEALSRARWLAGVGETALAVQHEINNPLAALMTHAGLLAADPATPQAMRPDLQAIDEQARRIADVVRRLASLDDARSVEYLPGAPMLDLSPRPPGGATRGGLPAGAAAVRFLPSARRATTIHPASARLTARTPRPPMRPLAAAAAALALPVPLLAHVKWFSRFTFADRPLTLREVLTPTFVGLLLLSMATIAALTVVDRKITHRRSYQRVNQWLSDRSGAAVLVMRVGIGASLLLSWQADALLAPELRIAAAPWLGWAEFACAFLLLFDRTVPLAGLGVMALFGAGLLRVGLFHMLDYVLFLGAGYYLAVSASARRGVRGTGLPALYLSIGFSLCWVALEKLVYPQWGLYLLAQNPQLALGLDSRFFLTAAAFVEFSLGYLLIINLLQRPMALLITITFFLTTLVFGKLEVIGHTPIHAALIVFLLEGPGRVYPPPIALHRRLPVRTAFAAVNFALLLGILLLPYTAGARRAHSAWVRDGRHAALDPGTR